MFITAELAAASGTKLFQFSDSVLTLRMLGSVVSMCARQADVFATKSLEYCDEDGDWVRVCSDADVAEFFAVATAMKPRSIAVRLIDGIALPAAPSSPADASSDSLSSSPEPVAVVAASAAPIVPKLWDNTLSFYVNGSPVSITNPDPTMHLVDYLRDVLLLKATKIGCFEGGCGACTVVLSWNDSSSGTVKYKPINACLRPLAAMSGFNVITAEGIGSQAKGYHPVQTALAKSNGSQCGFCTVGWTMEMYAMLQNNPKPAAWQVDNSFDGNLCRCTGMFPILAGFHTLSSGDSSGTGCCSGGSGSGSGGTGDIKDLLSKMSPAEIKRLPAHLRPKGCNDDCNSCMHKGACHPDGDVEDFGRLVKRSDTASAGAGGCCGGAGSSPSPQTLLPPPMPLPKKLRTYKPTSKYFSVVRDEVTVEWYSPTTLADLTALQAQFASAAAGTVKYVCGNTSFGVEKYFNTPRFPTGYTVFIDVNNVPDLTATSYSASAGLTVGASVSLADVITLCHAQDPMAPLYTNDPTTEAVATATSSFSALSRHLLKVAHHQVRSVGSWAGNLMMATHYHDFPSDVVLMLMSLGVTLKVVQSGTVVPAMTVEQLYATAQSNTPNFLIVSMTVPNLQGVTAATPGPYVIDSFKVTLRHQNTHALCSAGFVLQLGSSSGSRAVGAPASTVTSARMFFGAVGKELFRASKTEAAITGQPINQATLTACLAALTQDIAACGPSDYYGTTDAYRQQTAAALLFKLFVRATPSSALAATVQSAGLRYVRPACTESSSYKSDPSEAPVSSPVPKLGIQQQVAGEVQFTYDVKLDRDGLCGALAVTTQASGVIASIDFETAAGMPGVVRVISVADIPTGGSNDIGSIPGQEKMFLTVGDSVSCIGQPVALVVADTFQHALEAARAVTLSYNAPTTPPIFTIADAIAAKSFYPNGTPNRFSPAGGVQKGNAASAIAASAHQVSGTLTMGGQKHMYMEVQNAVASMVDGTVQMQISTQAVAMAQTAAVRITGLPANHVDVQCRRTGGGFGGKLTRHIPLAASAALGAYVTGKQVHVQLDRCQDSIMTGGREEVYCEYSFGVDATGAIQGYQLTAYTNGGAFMDGAWGDLDLFIMIADSVYNFPNYSVQGTVCKTNLAATTSMRAPGATQSLFMLESIMDQVAKAIGMDPLLFRQNNFLAIGDSTPYGQPIQYLSLPTVWQTIQDQANYTSTKAAVDAFNASNRWRKRGISIIPLKYGIGWTFFPAQAIIRVYGDDGTVEVSTSGQEIGQGLYTKVAQVVAFELGVDISTVNVVPTRTDTSPAFIFTGGSFGSEMSCQAAINACAVLNTRLAPIKAKLGSAATWMQVVNAAFGEQADLTAEGWFTDVGSSASLFKYFVYAAACSTVEIDVLTGEVELLRSDIVYDCGESLNPLLDVGQVEGGFVMGLGEYLTEQVVYSPSGELLSLGTFEYKPPTTLDIPQVMNTTLLPDCPNPTGILSSKASGEPSYALAMSAHFAIKYAVYSARNDAGNTSYFDLPLPATPCAIATACATTTSMFQLTAPSADDGAVAAAAPRRV